MPDARPQEETEWHALDVDEVLASLNTDGQQGLAPDDAAARLEDHGPNSIESAGGIGRLRLLLNQLLQPLVLILIAAGTVTAITQHWVDAGVIFGVVVVNALIGYLQEAKAAKAIEALAGSMSSEANVVRAGQRVRVAAEVLVPGDVVILQAGDKIPADVRMMQARDLRVDESALTGESVPVDKTTEVIEASTGLADRQNMGYSSTLVSSGFATAVVVETGGATEIGRISHLLGEVDELQTPLTRRIARFSKYLLIVILGMAALTVVVGVLRGQPLVDMFLAAVALAVGAIPEGLPAAVTIVLAIGVSRMAHRRAIVRKLPAVETLGSTTVICSDKTGTLTENQMTVRHVFTPHAEYEVSGGGYAPEGKIRVCGTEQEPGPERLTLDELLRAGSLCNDSTVAESEGQWSVSGDPTEGALLVSAHKAGIRHVDVARRYRRVDSVPFTSESRLMATLHDMPDAPSEGPETAVRPKGGRVIYVKGAMEQIVERCSHQMGAYGQEEPFDAQTVERAALRMAGEGLRVLAFARKLVPAEVGELKSEDVEEGLVFLGLQGMIDPPRPEALSAIKACHAAGIQVKMITGDHVVTAVAIARLLGVQRPGDPMEQKAMTGAELREVPEERFEEAVEQAYVFARVSPEQKLSLVQAMQARGHVVAMTGDGVNDAPALRRADIGIAMGITGTEVAKEAADMILTDDNFASIEAAVEEGRGVFDNIKKFITWTLPTNIGEGLVILAAVFIGTELPITPVQILWINMTTAVLLGLMLAFEPKEAGIMQRKPHAPGAPILDKVLTKRIISVGIMLLAGAFGLFEYMQQAGYSDEVSRTVAVNVFVFGEMFYLFNCRSLSEASWRTGLRANHFLFGGVGLMAGLQILYTYLPGMNALFGSEPIGWLPWLLIIAAGSVIHVVVEVEKWLYRRSDAKKPV